MWKGFAFPLRSGDKGIFKTASDIELIKGNILQILGTRKGERVTRPLFGSRLMDFIHEPLHDSVIPLIRFDLIDAIKTWEPRVVLNKKETAVVLYPGEFKVRAILKFRMKTTGAEYSYSLGADRKSGVYQWRD